MLKRALFLSLLPALALASPVTQSGVTKRDDRTYSGTATIYVTPLNACEIDTDDIVAFVGVGDDVYDEGDTCGDMITITETHSGITASAMIVDYCGTCNAGDLIVTPWLGRKLNGGGWPSGALSVSWVFNATASI